MRGADRRRVRLGRWPQLSLRDARRKALQVAQERCDGTEPSIRVAEAVKQYLLAQAARTRPNTQRDVSRVLERYLLPRCGKEDVRAITTAQLTKITDGLLKTPAEAIKVHSKLSGFFEWCRKRQMIEKNPLAGVSPPARQRSRDRVLTDVEMAAILRTALRWPNTYGALVLLLAYTGLRKMEGYTLTWDRVTRDTIHIPKELAKNGIELLLPNTVQGYLSLIPKTSLKLFPAKINWPREKEKLQAASGTSDWTLHDFRRYLSTRAADLEMADATTIEAVLNHVSGSKVARIYNRSKLLVPMRRFMSTWADHLHTLISPQAPPSLS